MQPWFEIKNLVNHLKGRSLEESTGPLSSNSVADFHYPSPFYLYSFHPIGSPFTCFDAKEYGKLMIITFGYETRCTFGQVPNAASIPE